MLLFRNCVKCFLVVWIFNQNAVREVFAVFQLLVYPLQSTVIVVAAAVYIVVGIKH